MSNKDDGKKSAPAAAPAVAPKPPAEPPKFVVQLKKTLTVVTDFSKKIIKSPVVISAIRFIKKLGWEGWLKLATCISLGVLCFVVYKTAPYWKKLWKLPYITSFAEVSDKKITYEPGVNVVRYNNDLLAPQYIVLISKIVVNIQAGRKSTRNPMIAFDLFVRTDNEEASIEVRKREKELQDHIQRFCETLNYDQILTEEGKQIWKQKIKRELNLVLNTGQVKDVFFKTLLLKP